VILLRIAIHTVGIFAEMYLFQYVAIV
jgi:hypothetical protein